MLTLDASVDAMQKEEQKEGITPKVNQPMTQVLIEPAMRLDEALMTELAP